MMILNVQAGESIAVSGNAALHGGANGATPTLGDASGSSSTHVVAAPGSTIELHIGSVKALVLSVDPATNQPVAIFPGRIQCQGLDDLSAVPTPVSSDRT